ncbi:head scaffolding protein [Citrobacter phage Moon]|uniref:Prohead core protein n=3 Tax=Moonvirus TaxID=1985329 RepID=A0A0K1LNV6_9CAUD|nr:head scaffolding protein [Citrobacter phage Moon]YP_009203908.1 head scaffolding protein [Citrobacter phage Merlin]YP_009618252.1 head scaffolding protein [Citrobacter phage CF1 ERZ-2017]YP_010844075.1 capsid and scaffold protein [Salmonella phage KM16]AIX12161.1 prohead core protein [Citrobacter phage Moon]AKU43840.1 prohead core protein [Citrobacter phage Merlin]AUE23066.1 prohead core protein [Citrobacter phage CF1 ERZ-2017]
MFLIPDNHELVIESVELLLPEAQGRYDALSGALSKDDINTIVENMMETETDLAVALGSINEEMQLDEFIVKHVSSRGEITRTKDRKTRARNAFQTTGLSKAKRRSIARKATKSKRANPSGQARGLRKRKKAMKRREALGLS